jgi:hypothetical protein
MQIPPDAYGVMAEFETGEALLEAARRAHEAGYRRMDGFSPFPLHGLSEALGFRRTRLPLVTLIGGLLGGGGAYFMLWYASVIRYPINIGGRPLHSWPAFIPITFELTVLGAAFFALFGMFALNGLPMPYHPVFNVPEFVRASRDRFFLLIEARDPKFHIGDTRQFLDSLTPEQVFEVWP